ncbi:uncharacterized, partial [Tachysurus ichikawai]
VVEDERVAPLGALTVVLKQVISNLKEVSSKRLLASFPPRLVSL